MTGTSGEENHSQSMTGYGHATDQNDRISLEVELRSINSRYLDIHLRIPKVYQRFESEIRSCVSQKLHRGRVDVSIARVPVGENRTLAGDLDLAKQYYDLGKKFCETQGVWNEKLGGQLAIEILGRREVLDTQEEESLDEENELVLLKESLNEALSGLQAMRTKEGAALSQEIRQRFSSLEQLRQKIQTLAEDNAEEIKRKLHERVAKLLDSKELDSERMALEVALLSDKADVTEELSRLTSHFGQASDILREQPHGRKLEFLLQEIGREFNTIGSKVQHAAIQQHVVDAKAELEKIREQVQNIE